jgi:hypothetical protein
MMRRAALAAALALGASGCAGAGAADAMPDPNQTCQLRHPATYVDSLQRLPPDLRASLKVTAGAMADRGAFFNAGDAITKPGPFNRFIRGGQAGAHWFAWYEHGGFAYWRQIVIFDTRYNGRIVVDARATAPDLCAETDRLLDGIKP